MQAVKARRQQGHARRAGQRRRNDFRRAIPSPIAPRLRGFVAAYDAKHAIARDGDAAKLTIGSDDFPFAFPLVKTGDRWRFDTAARQGPSCIARRIGENELYAIKVLQAIVDAQRDYASEDRDGDGVLAYARKDS